MSTIEVQVIPVAEIAERLPYEQAITAIAIALEEVCIARALVIIHGPDHGARKYVELGGRMRTGTDGEPVLLWREGMESRL